MDRQNLIENNGIVFNAKPDAVPYNYRVSYKVSQICLILAKSCWGRSGCLPVKLHMISFALCSKSTMDKLVNFALNEFADTPIIRFDPAVNRAVTFAIADNLIIHSKNGKYTLTDKGKKFVEEIDKDPTVLAAEKLDLSELSKKLTDEKIKQLSYIWRNTYAED
ncbi:hypothetical protein HZF24_04630 [Sedimentibacter hydroxybenzoicus DSM 7310]|uniref:Uncharacterized protein n=1 Tax=Sedimentibacter hydroxybenzoicus DSM 7310 TaxID=1123245 RepID=A0A974BHW1_SEDHY|nr:hypothetical protein [Sedimentibacter hydroxybenzoicus]NYB73422.1 hypothetical protein [Sedimentibacter hydroxybenzoicus DSM 7310]